MNRPKPRVTTALLQRRARELRRHLPAASAGDATALHQARVASRRLRETVPVLATGVKGSKAGRAGRKVRRLTRALGAVRELDVAVRILDELARRERLPRAALEQVRGHVLAERDRRREVMFERLKRVDVPKLGRRLSTLASALQHSASSEWRTTLAARLAKRSVRLAAAMADAGQIYQPERLHRVRIAAKKLRYALEIAAETRSAAAAAPLRLLKRVQDDLGRLHDLNVLEAHVAALQAAPPSDRQAPAGGLDAIGQALEAECRHLHARYLAAAPTLLEVCDATRHQIAPHVAARAGRPRAIKMSLSQRRSATRRA